MAAVIIGCGRPKKTAGPVTDPDGLPSDWDGSTDYESGTWKVEAP